jgi:hypothetical protein
METTYASQTSVDIQRTTRCYISEHRNVHNHRCENLKPYKIFIKVDTLLAFWFLGLLFNPEEGGNMFIWNISLL